MNKAQRPDPRSTTTALADLILVCVFVASTLAMTSVALAQQSATYDLGCWSVSTGGGGLRSSSTTLLRDAVVGGAAGITTSANYRLRAGYAQSWTFPTQTAADGVDAAGRR